MTQQSRRRVKFTIKDDACFKNCLFIDVVQIDGKKCLHVVDAATRYQSAKRLRNETLAEEWNALHACWTDVYPEPPDIITNDAGSNLVSREFAVNCSVLYVDAVLKENLQSMTTVDRQHAPLGRAFTVIDKDAHLLRLNFPALRYRIAVFIPSFRWHANRLTMT